RPARPGLVGGALRGLAPLPDLGRPPAPRPPGGRDRRDRRAPTRRRPSPPPAPAPAPSGTGDQAEFGGGGEADVAGDDADGVAEGAGRGEGDLAFEGPAVGGALAVLLEGGQLDVGELVGVVDAAVGDLDLDLSGVEVAQLEQGPDREPGSEQAPPVAFLSPA